MTPFLFLTCTCIEAPDERKRVNLCASESGWGSVERVWYGAAVPSSASIYVKMLTVNIIFDVSFRITRNLTLNREQG